MRRDRVELLVAFALCSAIVVLAAHRLRGPAPKGTDAAVDAFSAARASETLRYVLGDGKPHPSGSRANQAVRDRIVQRLTALGYAPHVQRRWACGGWGGCGTVENIIARAPGRERGPAVLLVAHYDSVAAGPGAADDGAGVASLLEIARVISAGPPLRNPVIFLVDDGEEAGLLGAEAFVRHHPWYRDVGTVINLEARGTAGASFMFETGPGNAAIVRDLKSLARPAASSLFYSIYQRLPNDTDFTVFKRSGLQGVNFAFVRGVGRYHTPRDDLAALSLRSLQHHGDNALAMLRTLGNASSPPTAKADAVYFDVLQFAIVSWPAGMTRVLLLLSGILVAVTVGNEVRKGNARGVAFGLSRIAGGLTIAVLLAAAGTYILRSSGAFPTDWVAQPAAAIVFFWSLALAALTFAAAGGDSRGLSTAAAIVWWLLAAGAAILLPGAVYLFVLPAVLAPLDKLSVAGAVVAATLFAPLAMALHDGMGLTVMPVVTVCVALMAMPLLPLLTEKQAGRRVSACGLVVSVVALAVAALQSPYDTQCPRRLNIRLHQESGRNAARIVVNGAPEELPDSMRSAARWSNASNPFPWQGGGVVAVSDTRRLQLVAPEVTTLRAPVASPLRRIVLRIVPHEKYDRITLALHDRGALVAVRAQGETVTAALRRRRDARGWSVTRLHAIPSEGIEVELVLRSNARIDGVVEGMLYAVPALATSILAARPEWAVASGEGDAVIVTRPVSIP